MTCYINAKERHASIRLGTSLLDCMKNHPVSWDEIIFLCIGSDRITGDSLGPLIGHQLSKCHLDHVQIYGTLSHPVHALNLSETINKISSRHPSALLVAIDASLGSKKHLGFITVGNGTISPGAGVHKKLDPVGDIFITGIVNLAGTFEHFLLQTTRLSTVVSMADSITNGILMAYYEYFCEHPLPFLELRQPEEDGRLRSWVNTTPLAASASEPYGSR